MILFLGAIPCRASVDLFFFVVNLRGMGITSVQVASVLGIADNTIRKAYRDITKRRDLILPASVVTRFGLDSTDQLR